MTHIIEKRVFVWLAQQMRRTQFIEWSREKGFGQFSHPTLRRAMDRQYMGEKLTERQKGIERIALEFKKIIEDEMQQPATAA